jgi:catechol-2,3-dioxygenase
MFDHVLLNVSSKAHSIEFYSPTLQILGINKLYDENEYAAYGIDRFYFWLRESNQADVTRKMHIAFSAGSRKQVEEFYQAALNAGGRSNGGPGIREHGPSYYAAYVLDLEGNNIEVVCSK